MKWWLRWRLRVWEREMFIARGRMEMVHVDEAVYKGLLNEYAAALTQVDHFRRKLDSPPTSKDEG